MLMPFSFRFPSRRLALLAALALLLPARTALEAQGAFSPPPVAHSRVISINPLLLVFIGSISADFEQRVAPSVTAGVSASSFNVSRADYLTIEGRARYYLSGRALDGFAVGASLGVASLREENDGAKGSAMLIGFLGERQWLVGPEERLALTAGLGASRLFFAPDNDAFHTVLPTIRLSLGWGF
jgi:hypothetical protein